MDNTTRCRMKRRSDRPPPRPLDSVRDVRSLPLQPVSSTPAVCNMHSVVLGDYNMDRVAPCQGVFYRCNVTNVAAVKKYLYYWPPSR